MIVIAIERNSATTIDDHIPSTPNTNGRRKTNPSWNTNVLKNEINADINPLFNPVKNDEPNIEKPVNK